MKLLEFFRRASELAPEWPYPIYDAAFTYLMQGDSETALEYYELADSLAPSGFFIVKTAVHTLKGEKAGIYPSGLYLNYIQLEWLTDQDERMNKVKSMIDAAPNYAPAWEELAKLEFDNKEMIEAINKGLSLNPDLDTKGNLLINKAICFSNSNRYNESIEILGKLITDTNTTIGVREGAKFVLSYIIGANN
jgi:tetratricopeptide (TPR) repeat protein